MSTPEIPRQVLHVVGSFVMMYPVLRDDLNTVTRALLSDAEGAGHRDDEPLERLLERYRELVHERAPAMESEFEPIAQRLRLASTQRAVLERGGVTWRTTGGQVQQAQAVSSRPVAGSMVALDDLVDLRQLAKDLRAFALKVKRPH